MQDVRGTRESIAEIPGKMVWMDTEVAPKTAPAGPCSKPRTSEFQNRGDGDELKQFIPPPFFFL